ncbi:MAG: sulfatase [Planctomycetaceae bacterium]|jgi:uncharacterized sulfatase|nr:sulfatase [Planctomycetaceae bacterium]
MTIRFISTLLIFLFGGSAIFTEEPQKAKPNVLFIITEDTHWNVFGCYGNPICKTPNIDKLAAGGIRFEHAYCQASACNATRTSFIHGARPKTTRIWNNDQSTQERLPEKFAHTNMPQLFKDAGYTTIDVGKFYHRVEFAPDQVAVFDRIESYAKPQGWNGPPPILNFTNVRTDLTKRTNSNYGDSGLNFEDEGDTRRSQITVTLLEEYVKDQSPDKKPFFLVSSRAKPHTPYLSPTKYATMYDPATIPDPPAPVSSLQDFPYITRSTGINPDIFRQAPATPDEAKNAIAAYYGCVTFIDDTIGSVLDTLEKTGLDKNTIVVLIGDHGVHLGDHNMWSKYSMLEGTQRAPFILRVPGAKENGKVCNEIVEFVDILPTLIDLCGLQKPKHLEGVSLKPLLENVEKPWKNAAFLVDQDLGEVVRTKKYSYMEFGGRTQSRSTWVADGYKGALFDLEKDPYETINLIDNPAYSEVQKELVDLLHQGWKAALPPSTVP